MSSAGRILCDRCPGITDDDPSRELAYLRSFLDRQVDGLILISSHALASVEAAGPTPTPVVVLDRTDDAGSSSSVHVDNVHDAGYAVEHLQGHGHRLIGCVAGPRTVQLSADRIAGWRRQQGLFGLEHGEDLIAHAEFSEVGGSAAAHALLGPDSRTRALRGERPTALFVSSDTQALGAMHACDVLGLRIPEDVAIASFDGTRAASFTRPPLTTMSQPVNEIARLAVGHLLARIADPSTPLKRTVVRGHLLLGQSCGCGR